MFREKRISKNNVKKLELPTQLFVMTNDSMSPTIPHNHLAIVAAHSSHNEDGIYAFYYRRRTQIARIQFKKDEITLIRDNEEYPPETLLIDDFTHLKLIGRVVGVIRNV